MKTTKSSFNHSSTGEMFVMACSGASDIGCLTDQVARRLRDNGVRSMKCLAMVASDNLPLIESLKTTKNVLIIDGCDVDCGKKIMAKAGIADYKYLRITDLGYIKGQTPVTDEAIKTVYEKAKSVQ